MRADVFTPAQRSAVMRAVKSRDTSPERAVRRTVCALGYQRRYRLHGRGLPSKPDLVLASMRKAIFVHGCFWHGHACRRGARAPKNNAAYWSAKIARNRARDASALQALAALGWRTLVIWECQARDQNALTRRLRRFLER